MVAGIRNAVQQHAGELIVYQKRRVEPAQAYLDRKRAGIKDGFADVSTKVVRGEPVSQILSAARDFAADLIVLDTHGSGHLDAFWSGKVTPRLIKKSSTPLLLVPVSENRGHSWD